MKKIITAIGNPNLNKNLKKEDNFEILSEDIQYQEGILEFLEKETNIDFLILSELLPGNIELKKLIEKIKLINNNIQIILFLEKPNEELENYFYAKGISFIFYNNQIETKDIIQIINTNKIDKNNELKKEINELKKLLEEKEKNEKINLNLHNIQKRKKDTILEKEKISTNNKKEIICVSGTSGVGKSIFTINLAKTINKNKVLIIDFDILNNSLHTILGVRKYSLKIREKINRKMYNIQPEELVIKINSKIDLISGINILFDLKNKISCSKLKEILEGLKKYYDVIIIDTSSECFLDYTKEIMKLCNLNIFICGANLIEIKKAKKLLNIYSDVWKIPKRNFNILFNKYDLNSIDISILKNIFSECNILGKLSVDTKYNLIINKNSAGKLNKKLQKEYFEIYRNLLKKI